MSLPQLGDFPPFERLSDHMFATDHGKPLFPPDVANASTYRIEWPHGYGMFIFEISGDYLQFYHVLALALTEICCDEGFGKVAVRNSTWQNIISPATLIITPKDGWFLDDTTSMIANGQVVSYSVKHSMVCYNIDSLNMFGAVENGKQLVTKLAGICHSEPHKMIMYRITSHAGVLSFDDTFFVVRMSFPFWGSKDEKSNSNPEDEDWVLVNEEA
ncbi:MAG: hypothetical protein M1834_002117 [Cirrosporium novae-zelandiae]|nr:MAG: hypothetical protein M1834_002117 [Cirrosporium novae-zelandiae]